MRSIHFVSRSFLALPVGLLLLSTAGAPGHFGLAGAQAQAAETSAKAKKPDLARVRAHLKDHVKYPATRAEVLAACAETPEFSAEEKAWFAGALPDRTFASSDDVLKALKK